MNRTENRIAGRAAFGALIVLAFLIGSAAALSAHEGHGHEARGTIQSIAADKLELTSTDGKVVEFMLMDSTKYLRGEIPVKREDVAPGERAIVKFHEVSAMNHAVEVRLGEKKP
ncbi:MAG: hypothetical protein ABI689_17305 [Thermoanaerobaculia bacterium]